MAVIAWIEDDHERLGALVRLLEREHEIGRYKSFAEVSAHIEEVLESDALILDIILPSIESDPYLGLAVLKKLRENNYQKPIIVCSHVRNPNVYRNLLDLGVKDEYILRKPVRPSELYKVVIKALTQKK